MADKFYDNLFAGKALRKAAGDSGRKSSKDMKAGDKISIPKAPRKKLSPAQRQTESKARARHLKRTGAKLSFGKR